MTADRSMHSAMQRLCELSVRNAYDPFREFVWPDRLPDDQPWMSRDLLSLFDTPWFAELDERSLLSLGRCELVNFFSFNVHGIRELMLQVLAAIYKTGHEDVSAYFHHFLDEENKHMWFFAEFCKRYGGKIYMTQKPAFASFDDEDIQTFIAFAKILISEQVSDFYNVRMMRDDTLPEMVRMLNRVHHEDESRHIAMGVRVCTRLFDAVVAKHPKSTCLEVLDYLRRYMQFFVESFYNPSAYRDAGLADPYGLRRALLATPERQAFHARVLEKPTRFFTRFQEACQCR